MIDWIQGFGEFVIGLAALIFVALVVVAGLIEIFDALTGADKRKQAEKEQIESRLEAIEKDYS